MSIPFTQFLMPDGREQTVEIDRPPEVEARAHQLIERGWRFEIEMLQTGEISMEIVRTVKNEVVAIAGDICHNGPTVAGGPLGVPETVDKLIATAWEQV